MADPFFSEIKYLGGASLDFIEVAVDAGFDVSDLVVTVYRENGTIRSSNDLSLLTPTVVDGRDVYVITNTDATAFNGLALSEAVALSDSSTVFSFLSFDDTAGTITPTIGPAAGIPSTDIGEAPGGSSLETTDGGVTYFTQSTPDPGNVTCFAAGTVIDTPSGSVNVETLTTGAYVNTLDDGAKPLRQVFRRTIGKDELARNPKLSPVRICAGALGGGLPKQDLLVSRQHRMVVSSVIAKRMFGQTDVMVAAIHLTELPGIYVDTNLTNVTYVHLLFDTHDVVFANGAPSESMFLGAVALATLPKAVLREIRAIFPDLKLPLDTCAARLQMPSNARQSRLVQRHLKNRHAVQNFSPKKRIHHSPAV